MNAAGEAGACRACRRGLRPRGGGEKLQPAAKENHVGQRPPPCEDLDQHQ
jgi:hypothetical protein